MNTNDLTEQNILFSIISIFTLYLKIILFLIITSLMVYKIFKLKNDINLNFQKNLSRILFFIILYIFIDIIDSVNIYFHNKILIKEYDKIHLKIIENVNYKIINSDIKTNKIISKIYDDFNIKPKIDSLNGNKKQR